MSQRLKDKVIIVTGAGTRPLDQMGNGKATSIVFGKEGATVLCPDIDEEVATAAASLASDDAFYINGVVLSVDGGLLPG